MTPKYEISHAEIDELERFLLSDKTLDDCMNISELHGFLTCLQIGPETILPSQWLPEIWGETGINQMNWDSRDEADHIYRLLITFYNSISSILMNNPESYVPLFYEDDEGIPFVGDWCFGFDRGFDLDFDSWDPIFATDETKALMVSILMHGTEEGWQTLEKSKELRKVPPKEWAAMIQASVIHINNFWLPHRRAERDAGIRPTGKTIGRNDTCPCGSGKKFKHCCMN
ncbi:MAG: UPF0149 family protein [Candidatus Electryonea clarkiae]|nr:UPF0149 family protein [Candidatus Electryonea clarkiae]MDP8287193.1 UPF0149 family protein [Candidatus Electryonea clarkiae]